jgi:ABC-type glycerol-3-phosphate transport system permease component
MRLIGYLVLACVALAVLKVAVTALVIAALIAFAIAFIRRPGEALGFLVLVYAVNYPWAFAAVAMTALITRLLIHIIRW